MEYLDGVRKIYGKVKIIYADKDISKELKVKSSGESQISHKEQVVLGHTEPSIKACTMDGNATMGGNFQMRSLDQVCGWWSDVSSDSVGCFSTPPYLDVEFFARPIISWIVVGDTKLNQYPVDFNIICYNENGIELGRESIQNNDKVIAQIVFTLVPIDVTKIRLEILKWNKPNAKAKILSYFNTLEEEYLGSDIKDFEIVQELSQQIDNVAYGISSDTASISLYNKDRKFDRGYLKELVLLDRKVIPYIGIEKNGQIEYTQLGEFYSDEWKIPNDDAFSKVICVDKLMRLQDIIYLGYQLTENGSLYDMIADILEKSKYTEEDYEIDQSIMGITIANAYLPKGSAWDSLQEVLASNLLKCYINKNGKLIVSNRTTKGNYEKELTAKHITRYSETDKMTDFANKITLQYSDVLLDNTVITVFESGIVIEPLCEQSYVIDYNGLISNATLDYTSKSGLELISHTAYPNCSEIVFKNTSNTLYSLDIKIQGNAIKLNTQSVIVQDNESIERFGIKAYNHGASFLVQSYEQATTIGNTLLERLSMKAGRLDIDFRGDPSLELEQVVECSNRYGDKITAICEYNRYTFNGGLTQQTKGRIIKGGS